MTISILPNGTMTSPQLGDIVRQFQDDYVAQFGNVMLPSQKKALSDIADCTTPAMGGQLMLCDDCDHAFWIYFGCRNRSCPKCHGAQTQQWLEDRSAELLPCPYFHLIVTVPPGLHGVMLKNQKVMYGLLMKTVSQTVLEFAENPRYIGGMPAVMTVLHTWNSKLEFHPHVHLLISGGGMTPEGTWSSSHASFLLPVKALSKVVSARIRDAVMQEFPIEFQTIPKKTWRGNWCSFCVPYGQGQDSVLNYLGRYVFRIAITQRRLLSMTDSTVTFEYKDRKAGVMKTETISGTDFLGRFLLHVLPRGFHKVRYYGLWHHSHKDMMTEARTILEAIPPVTIAELGEIVVSQETPEEKKRFGECCPKCGNAKLILVGEAGRGELADRSRASPK